MDEDVYVELRRFLDGLPAGYPETSTGVELKILQKLFTPEEARLTMHLRQFAEPARVIAERSGMTAEAAETLLSSMAQKGLILGLRSGGESYYMAVQFMVGIYEFHVDTLDRELVDLMEEYFDSWQGVGSGQIRVVPVQAAVDVTTHVASYDQARKLVHRQKVASLAECICRKEKGLLGEECRKPHETCMGFGLGAEYYISTGKGRRISINDAMDVIDMAEENAMVLSPANARDISFMCCCCGCCCGVIRVLRMEDRPADHIRSGFQATIDKDACAACRACLDRCQIEAIVEGQYSMHVDPARCIGCGLCVSTCPENAVSLVPRRQSTALPTNLFDTLAGMSRRRGLGFGKLQPIMRRTKVPLFTKSLPLLYRSGLGKPLVDQMAKKGWV
jgi:Na+-translocating ferredoxin:NAD+ oxidoreductase subunit B